MGTSQKLSTAQWRKSSYSGDTGGQCVECAPLGTAQWIKSSHSSSNGGECVEVAPLTPHIAIRDSKNPGGGILTLSAAAFSAFLGHVSGDR
ncbi:DUF397 domain-containing protein [Streptomyces neyagawaensis]|uniref:DUF397 domain-containing protein n=1 Tax=Streptomyces neyagawaensis TaxID=42238 RepID=UPI0006E286FD|nr:DUF397 domain-containing protein [Streptomyces neyagawaensis]MCL6734665.1 DUF397 domain-containing protein [Streptomyces neyagawaensis]MDE1682172.1 DUF397 domain-containing protein [Streptomyces neyagawaensis]